MAWFIKPFINRTSDFYCLQGVALLSAAFILNISSGGTFSVISQALLCVGLFAAINLWGYQQGYFKPREQPLREKLQAVGADKMVTLLDAFRNAPIDDNILKQQSAILHQQNSKHAKPNKKPKNPPALTKQSAKQKTRTISLAV